MCLKRYSVLPNGNAIRLNTYIDIPTQIGLPHFIQDDALDEDGLLYGNFKLLLQSVVCHRGNSLDSGHYIALVRGTNSTAAPSTSHSSDANSLLSSDSSEQWMRFDDLAPERITRVNIEQALKEESPYLLFYQIVPVDDNSSMHETLGDKRTSFIREPEDFKAYVEKEPTTNLEPPSDTDTYVPSVRLSFDLSSLRPPQESTENLNFSDSQDKLTTNNNNANVGSNAILRDAFSHRRSLSLPRKNKDSQSRSRSRGGDQSGDKRISAAFSKLTMRMSKDKATDENDGLTDTEDVPSVLVEETEVKEEKRGRESAYKNNNGKQRQRSRKGRNNPDRECVMM
jgi:Ubiquitin carboxyl-terminal hydrolase